MSITAAIHDRLVDAIAQLVIDLDLEGEPGVVGDVGANVYRHLLPEVLSVKFPCALVTTEDCTDEESADDSDFEADGVVHPVKVIILDSVQGNFQQRRPTYQRWRHDVSRKLRGLVNPPLFPDVPEVFDIRLRNLPQDLGKGRSQYFQAGLYALCHTVEDRQRGPDS